MKPVLSIVPLNQQSRTAATVSNARLQAIRDADQRARHAEGQLPEGYADDLSPFSEADRLALRNLGVAILIAGVVLVAVAAVWP